MGYDVRSDRIVDMLEAGIIDPAQVPKVALLSAASVTNLLLTASAESDLMRAVWEVMRAKDAAEADEPVG